MNTNQKMFVYIPEFAEKIRDISSNKFFIECCDIKDAEKEKGILERIISESVMCMFHFNKWNKNGKKLATYLNENGTKEQFEKLNNNIKRLENIITDSTKVLFNSKDCFIWFTLFNKFLEIELDDCKFNEFLTAFLESLRNEPVDGKLFDKVDETGSTKDKRVIESKLHILETLMKEYLHIEESENKPVTKEEFIAENVELPIEEVKADMDVYEDTLTDLEDKTIRDGSKLLNDNNHMSLLAIVAYAYKNDIDLDNWMEEYASNNNTYYVDQKKNFLYMVKDLTAYNKRMGVA